MRKLCGVLLAATKRGLNEFCFDSATMLCAMQRLRTQIYLTEWVIKKNERCNPNKREREPSTYVRQRLTIQLQEAWENKK